MNTSVNSCLPVWTRIVAFAVNALLVTFVMVSSNTAHAQQLLLKYNITLSNIYTGGSAANRTGTLSIYSKAQLSSNTYEVELDSTQDSKIGAIQYVSDQALYPYPHSVAKQTASVFYYSKYNNPASPYNGYPIIVLQTSGNQYGVMNPGYFFLKCWR